jgi:DNA-binding transcriptional ArsR family regulator
LLPERKDGLIVEIEGLFSSGKWSLIELLAKDELSPIQLAEKLNTSVANVSQQLKMLELIGIVTTRKVSNRERGKPRTMFSISHDYVFVISALKNFAKKSFIKASPFHAVVSRILCFPDVELHYPLMKLFWNLEQYLEGITSMVFEKSTLTMHVGAPKPSTMKLQSLYSFKQESGACTLHVKVVSEIKSLKEGQYAIYDPEHRLKEEVKEQ